MKKFVQKIFTLTMIFVATNATAQNEVYWREGFEPDQNSTLTTTNPTSIIPTPTTDVTYYFNGVGGSWWGKNLYRTTGTACINPPYGPNHVRFRNMGAAGTFDSGALVLPVVDFGIQEFHFSRARASRTYTIWVTTDTNANTTNWTNPITLRGSTSTPLCTGSATNDTTVIIASPNAKRLKLVTRAGLDVDIDSIWITSFSQILPVKFGALSASMNAGLVKLNWNIESEINTNSYQIERSFNGREFTVVGTIEARKLNNYSWVDANNSTAYYRIKAIDKDGKLTASNIVKVSTEKATKFELNAYPNPLTNGRLNVELNGISKGDYKLNIYNIIGSLVYTTSVSSQGNSVVKSIDLPSFVKSGTYLVEVTNGNFKSTKTILAN